MCTKVDEGLDDVKGSGYVNSAIPVVTSNAHSSKKISSVASSSARSPSFSLWPLRLTCLRKVLIATTTMLVITRVVPPTDRFTWSDMHCRTRGINRHTGRPRMGQLAKGKWKLMNAVRLTMKAQSEITWKALFDMTYIKLNLLPRSEMRGISA